MKDLTHEARRTTLEREGNARTGKRLLVFSVFLLILLTLASLLSEKSLPRLYRLYKERAELQREIARLKGSIGTLERELGSFQKDPERIEGLAREELGLVKPGEVVYQFSKPFMRTPPIADAPPHQESMR